MSRFMDAIVPNGATALALVASATAQQQIADWVPPETFAVLQTREFHRVQEAFRQSELGLLTEQPEMRRFIDGVLEEARSELESLLAGIDAESEDLSRPEGLTGAAAFVIEEDDEIDVGVIMLADFGDAAEDLGELLEEALERGEEDERLTLEEIDHHGVRVFLVTPIVEDDPDAFDPRDLSREDLGMTEEEFQIWLGQWEDWESQLQPPTYAIAWAGTVLLASNREIGVTFALDAEADAVDESLADIPEYEQAFAAMGDDVHVQSALFPQRIMGPALERAMMVDEGFDLSAVIHVLGLADVPWVTGTLSLDTPDALLESEVLVHAPARHGVLALLEHDAVPFNPPAFVGPDVANVNSLRVDFSAIMPLTKDVIAELNDEMRQIAEAWLTQTGPLVEQVLQAIGPQLHVVQSYRRPFEADSDRTIVALELQDEMVVSNLLAMFGPAVQLEARDFEGGTIWSTDSLPMTIAIGVGFGHAFFGSAESVEGVMRLAANPGGPRLATEERFKQAVSSLPDAIDHGYVNVDEEIRWLLWSTANSPEIEAQRWATLMQLDDAAMQEWIDEARENQPDWVRLLPQPEVILEHIGDYVSTVRVDDDGFVIQTKVLRPRR